MLTRLELYEFGAMLLATGTFFMWRDALHPPQGDWNFTSVARCYWNFMSVAQYT